MIDKIAQIIGNVFVGLFQSPRDYYLSQSTDLADLERRMKNWERHHHTYMSNYTTHLK